MCVHRRHHQRAAHQPVRSFVRFAGNARGHAFLQNAHAAAQRGDGGLANPSPSCPPSSSPKAHSLGTLPALCGCAFFAPLVAHPQQRKTDGQEMRAAIPSAGGDSAEAGSPPGASSTTTSERAHPAGFGTHRYAVVSSHESAGEIAPLGSRPPPRRVVTTAGRRISILGSEYAIANAKGNFDLPAEGVAVSTTRSRAQNGGTAASAAASISADGTAVTANQADAQRAKSLSPRGRSALTLRAPSCTRAQRARGAAAAVALTSTRRSPGARDYSGQSRGPRVKPARAAQRWIATPTTQINYEALRSAFSLTARPG